MPDKSSGQHCARPSSSVRKDAMIRWPECRLQSFRLLDAMGWRGHRPAAQVIRLRGWQAHGRVPSVPARLAVSPEGRERSRCPSGPSRRQQTTPLPLEPLRPRSAWAGEESPAGMPGGRARSAHRSGRTMRCQERPRAGAAPRSPGGRVRVHADRPRPRAMWPGERPQSKDRFRPAANRPDRPRDRPARHGAAPRRRAPRRLRRLHGLQAPAAERLPRQEGRPQPERVEGRRWKPSDPEAAHRNCRREALPIQPDATCRRSGRTNLQTRPSSPEQRWRSCRCPGCLGPNRVISGFALF